MTREVIGEGRPPSLAARLTRAQLRGLLRPLLGPHIPLALQRGLTATLRWLVPPPRGVTSDTPAVPGFDGERHVPAGASADAPEAIVWFHGGGYSVCTPRSHRGVAAQLARATGRPVWVPGYRRAPEHPHPAALQDAQTAVAALVARGLDVRRSVFAGDSAGGHLALTLALARRDAGQTLPRALLLVSPWVDVTLAQLPPGADDALLTPAWMRQVRDAAFPAQPGETAAHPSAETAARRRAPLASPVFADLRGLPPVLIQSSAVEQLANDAERLHAALQAAGVPVQWQCWPGLWHDFQLHAGVVPEATDAIRRAAAFLASPPAR